VGCWTLGDDAARLDALREGTKADLLCASFRDATRLCVEAAKLIDGAVDATTSAAEAVDVVPSSNPAESVF